jgi:hypothetical protein
MEKARPRRDKPRWVMGEGTRGVKSVLIVSNEHEIKRARLHPVRVSLTRMS